MANTSILQPLMKASFIRVADVYALLSFQRRAWLQSSHIVNPCTYLAPTAAENEEKQLRGKIKKLDLAEGGIGEGDGKSRAVKINNRSAGQVSSIQSRKGVKAAFPAPSLDIVQQAFQMLDPTGSGTLNPVALREVMLPL